MKIAIFIDSLSIGGAQKHVRQLACGLAGRGHVVVVYALNDLVHPIYRDPLMARGVKVMVLGKVKVASGWGLLQAAAALRRDGCDVVVTVLFASTIFGRVLARVLGGIPVVTCLQARNINYSGAQKFLLRVTSGLTRLTVSNSRSAIAWAVEHEGVAARRCEFVANALDPIAPDGAGGNQVSSTWTALGFPQLEGKTVVGSVGRLHRQKGYDLLLEAFARIAGVRADCVLLLVGDGPERAALGEQARHLGLETKVWFAGERAEPSPLLGKMDLYVQPSRFEGTPNALMEAMAAGVPVVASAVDGMEELIEQERNGWLVPSGSPVPLAEVLTQVSSEPKWRKEIGECGRQGVMKKFGVSALCDSYERIFRRLEESEDTGERDGP